LTLARAGKEVFAALILTSLISTSGASARQSAGKQDQIRPQSTNQIVGASEQAKPAEQQSAEQQKPNEQKPAGQKQTEQVGGQGFEQAAIVPFAPNVAKRSSDVISVPADAAKPEPKFEERRVVSNVQVGSLFGYRSDPFTRRARFHAGVDIKARWGDTVGASQAGTVQFAGWYHGYGNLIIINHGGGVTTHYAHLSRFDVEVGRRVERGQLIGHAGSTGRATSPHLHYEVRLDGNPVNPFQTLALDPSSDYFKQPQASPADEATRPRRVN